MPIAKHDVLVVCIEIVVLVAVTAIVGITAIPMHTLVIVVEIYFVFTECNSS